MGKGSPVIPIRFPVDLLAVVDQEVSRSADYRTDGPWTRSSFVLAAVREKLAKMERSRKWRRKPAGPRAAGPAL